MDAAVGGRREEAERLRGYFDVQLMFAEVVAERTPCSLSDACLTVTNLHRRLGLGHLSGGAPSAAWAHYAAGLERCASRPSRLDWTIGFFADVSPDKSDTQRFGCFSYEVLSSDPVVRIHFDNRDSDDGVGPLARAKVGRRLSELREMFGLIRAHHPSVRTVRGGSWLYNLEAYRRLFPPEFAASIFEPEQVRLDGTSSWGQVLDFRGVVKPDVRRALLENIENVDIAAPWLAFPMRALGAQSPIDHFHAFYG